MCNHEGVFLLSHINTDFIMEQFYAASVSDNQSCSGCFMTAALPP